MFYLIKPKGLYECPYSPAIPARNHKISSKNNELQKKVRENEEKNLQKNQEDNALAGIAAKFVDDALSSYKICDVLYKATNASQTALLICHAEHYSSERQINILKTNYYAMGGLLEHHDKYPGEPLPPVLSLLYYNGKKPYTASVDPMDLFKHVPEAIRKHIFKPILIDLTQYSDKELAIHGSIEAFEILMKHGSDKNNKKTLAIFAETLHQQFPLMLYLIDYPVNFFLHFRELFFNSLFLEEIL